MRNIEIKVQLELKSLLSNLRKLNTIDFGILEQTDIYYLLGSSRLKIREEKNRYEVIYYRRGNKMGSKESLYYRVPLNNITLKVSKFFLHMFLGAKKVVKKQRNLHFHAHTRIHLDKVENIGEFLELETVVDNEHDSGYFMDEHKRIVNILNLSSFPQIAHSYSDFSTGV